MYSKVGGPRGPLNAAGVVGPGNTYIQKGGWLAHGQLMYSTGGGPRGHLCRAGVVSYDRGKV
jgi:hypothetical protein